ncbi:MAG: hypothetical protein MJE77_10685 [Proteobacteria bacterium]|nr:hypothetical protein [Pseudomonadota bacterium]
MSTRLVFTSIVVLTISVSIACVDPKKRVDEFGKRLVDAAPTCSVETGQIANLTGQFYVAINPISIQPGALIRYIADTTFKQTGNSFALDISIRPLDFETLELVPDATPTSWRDLPVDNEKAEFSAPLDGAVIPARANAAVPGLETTIVSGKIDGRILNANLWCGTITGMTNLGRQLDGSTVGAIRITAGTIGAALPPPVAECRCASDVADAGLPDAAMIDAAMQVGADTMSMF